MNNPVKIKMYCSLGLAGCQREEFLEVEREEWEDMDEDDRRTFLDDVAGDFLWDTIEHGAYVVDE